MLLLFNTLSGLRGSPVTAVAVPIWTEATDAGGTWTERTDAGGSWSEATDAGGTWVEATDAPTTK